jgi:hypothetical protein
VDKPSPPLCPSAQPDMDEAHVLGVLEDRDEGLQLSYLVEPVRVTDEILAQTGDVSPTRVFRFAATCEEKSCSHFDGVNCRLASRIVEGLSPVVDKLPPCRIRMKCRWFAQEGAAACLRCPQVVTEIAEPSAAIRAVALG